MIYTQPCLNILNIFDIRHQSIMQVQSPSLEYLLKKETPSYFSNLAWEISGTEEHGGLQSVGSQESDMT